MGILLDHQKAEELLGKGYYRFVALFSWPAKEDKVARDRFGLNFTKPEKLFEETGLEQKYLEAYSLVGQQQFWSSASQIKTPCCTNTVHSSPMERRLRPRFIMPWKAMH